MEENGRGRERERKKKKKKFRANATTDIKYWQISTNSNSIFGIQRRWDLWFSKRFDKGCAIPLIGWLMYDFHENFPTNFVPKPAFSLLA